MGDDDRIDKTIHTRPPVDKESGDPPPPDETPGGEQPAVDKTVVSQAPAGQAAGGQPPVDKTLASQPPADVGGQPPVDKTVMGAPPEPSLPQGYGPCRIIKALGSGGMGTVYLAEMAQDRHYAPAGTRVAVKVLHPELLRAPGAFKRFLREGELGIALQHPSVVRTYEVDAATAGTSTHHFLVMEYVEGRTLREVMDEHRVIAETLLRQLARQIASGLAAVHEAGAVHRDMKPENILITPDYQVKLMDLGIAHLAQDAARLTGTGQFIGTLLYASPEQFSGKGITPAADLYAFGVILYEAATGKQAIPGTDFLSLMRLHLEHVPARLREVNPDSTPVFEEVVACLLEKDPEQRFQSAAELAVVLEEGEAAAWWRGRERAKQVVTAPAELPRIRVPRETSVVGRDEELEALDSLFEEAKAGRGKLLLVQGEAGVGRTRLIDEFLRRLERRGEEVQALYGSHHPGGVGGGHGALAEAVVSHFGDVDLESKLAPYLTATPILVAPFAALLTGALGQPGAEGLPADAVHAVFCHLARGLAAERPLVWIVEDLHFGTADSRALLVSLARIAHDQRLLLIATSREGLPAEEQAHLDRLDITQKMELERLSARDVIRLLEEAFHSEGLAEELGGKVAARTDGNPFFIMETVKDLKGGDLLRREEDGSYTAGSRIAALTVPASVRDLLLARLKDLDKEDRALLDVGAVQGFSFDPDLLSRVRERKRLEVLEALTEMERSSGIIHSTGRGFTFDSNQLQEVIYESLPEMLQCEYHGMLAEAYEERAKLGDKPPEEVPGEAAVFLAEHYLKGEREEAGTRLLLPALDHLGRAYQNEALLDLAEMGLRSLNGGQAALRCDVRLKQADCLNVLARRDEQRAAVEEAIKAAEEAGDETRAAHGSSALGLVLISVADFPTAREALEKALERARSAGDREIEAVALGQLGLVLVNMGDYEGARQQYEDSVKISGEAGYRRGEAYAAVNLGIILRHTGRRDEATKVFQKYAEVCREIGDKRGEANIAGNLAIVFLDLGSHEQAQEYLERQLSLCRETGDRRGETAAAGNLGRIYLHLGHYERARVNLDRGLTLCRATDNRRVEAITLGNLGPLELLEGRLEEAGANLEQCLELCRSLGIRQVEAYALLDCGNLARARGEMDEAKRLYEDALDLFRELGIRDGIAGAALAQGRLLREQGDEEAARGLFEEADAISAELGLAEPGPLPAAYLALLGQRDPTEVEVTDAAPAAVRAEAHLVLQMAGAGGIHSLKVRALLEEMSEHLQGAERETFWKSNPVARMLAEHSGS